MAENKQDALARAYATLSSLRENIPPDVSETYVHEYHAVLDRLEGIGIDVSEFRIPKSEVAPKLVSVNTLTGEARHTRDKYVPRQYFLYKLDTVLSYFEIITAEKPKKIGFRTSRD